MSSHFVRLAVTAASLITLSAAAQDAVPRARGQGWSTLAHQTVGGGSTALSVQLGFPGLSVGVLHGLQNGFDLGGRLSFNYAHEGIVTILHPGVKAEALGRLKLIEGSRIGLALNFGLGFLTSFPPASSAIFGMTLPVGLVAGIPIGSALVVNIGVDMPWFVTFGAFGGLTAPILAGAGLEYFIDKSLLLSLNTRMGPAINPRVGRSAEFAFQTQLGIALKL